MFSLIYFLGQIQSDQVCYICILPASIIVKILKFTFSKKYKIQRGNRGSSLASIKHLTIDSETSSMFDLLS